MGVKTLIGFRRLVFIGFRGTGKSTLASSLSAKIEWPVISVDKRVVELVGLNIPEIVKKFGWERFRELETEVLRKISGENQVIVDCGGGVVENSRNMEMLSGYSQIVWVDAPPEIIIKRLESEKNRPFLTETDWKTDVTVNYLRRKPLYEKYSDFRIDTAVESCEQNIRTIMKELRKK